LHQGCDLQLVDVKKKKMKAVRSAMLPLKLLWDYREFKRDEFPAPLIPFVHMYNVEDVTAYVSRYGMDPVELSVIKDRALLTDGNHRIVAASRLGMERIPVTVVVYFNNGSETLYQHTLQRFLPINKELEAALRNMFLYGTDDGMIRQHPDLDGPYPWQEYSFGPEDSEQE
jgi:hypothetical protein